jgi:hypothetical protein
MLHQLLKTRRKFTADLAPQHAAELVSNFIADRARVDRIDPQGRASCRRHEPPNMVSHSYKAIDALAGSKPVKISLVGFEGGKVGVKGAVILPSFAASIRSDRASSRIYQESRISQSPHFPKRAQSPRTVMSQLIRKNVQRFSEEIMKI